MMIQQDSADTTLEVVKLIIPTVIGLLSGFLSARRATRDRMKEIEKNFKLQQIDKEKETKAKIKLQYLDPLRVSTESLRERISNIKQRKDKKDPEDTLLPDTIKQFLMNKNHKLEENVPYELWENNIEFIHWVNTMGHYAMSTLHLTTIYFACASKLRSELPYIELNVGNDTALLTHLSKVRRALGGPQGIWDELQDSLGNYIRKRDGSLMVYREFCNELLDDTRYLWFLRIIEFYGKDIYDKTKELDLQEMIDALSELEGFLKEVSHVSPIANRDGYHIETSVQPSIQASQLGIDESEVVN
jgi:hypothetical protein